MKSVQEVHQSLEQDQTFTGWKGQHTKSILSHFFLPLTADGQAKGNWEVGYYNPETEKITVFASTGNSFSIKPEDQVFSKETPKIDVLDISKVTVSFMDALDVYKQQKAEAFASQQLGDGFVVLQVIEGTPLWNFTFISKTLQFCNLRISTTEKVVVSSQVVDVVSKDM